MGAHRLTSSAGFTLVAAMVAVVIMGIMAAAMAQSWQTILKREREEELLFRGQQIRDAIAMWYKPRPGQPPTQQTRPLRDLKDLLEDPNTAATVRYLRRLYTDPITNKEFDLITDPAQGIIGVKSSSQDAPLKRGNFPDDMKDFADKDKYSDWQFNYRSKVLQQGQLRPPQGQRIQ
ncbi:MAG TPA: type II secretion system protein [Geobacteraceae bacterium]